MSGYICDLTFSMEVRTGMDRSIPESGFADEYFVSHKSNTPDKEESQNKELSVSFEGLVPVFGEEGIICCIFTIQ